MATGRIQVRGDEELARDFKAISRSLDRDLVKELKVAVDPVKRDAQGLALSRIGNMGQSPRWANMRIGISKARGLVYVMPASRNRGGSPRPNLANLLLGEAMDPAVDQNEQHVLTHVDDFLNRLGSDHGF